MNESTARALNAINRGFYGERAAEFSATRERPWPGWQRLWRILQQEGLGAAFAVLDVGCGNARLGRFLAERAPGLRYLGVDASPALLELARAGGGLGAAPELKALDLVEGDLAAQLGDRRFELVACFGLLHHLPGVARRRALLGQLAGRLAPGGLLAVTSWRLAGFARFHGRILSWEAYNESAEQPVDPAQLEPGDHLLPWGEGNGVRYVHFADEDETPALLAELPCDLVARYEADGREGNLNRYTILKQKGNERMGTFLISKETAKEKERPRVERNGTF